MVSSFFNGQYPSGEFFTFTESQQQPTAEEAADADDCVVHPSEGITAKQVDTLFDDSPHPDLSNSSLRRKLFFHGDEGTPLSPVR